MNKNKTKKILLCFGTRPEAIKMCTLIHKLKEVEHNIIKVCVTAQHREMLDQVLSFFDVVPDYDLDIMKSNQSLNELSSRILSKMDQVLMDFEPDLVLVHGDTTTSTICALAAFNRSIQIGHVEAGLRTYNKWSPFPEEINRQLTGKLADYHFAPTDTSRNNLLSEKVNADSIVVTGNTVIDSLLWTVDKLNNNFENETINGLKSQIDFTKKVILVTGHRRENFGEGVINLCDSLKNLASRGDVEIVFPVHLNPNVLKPVRESLGDSTNIHLIAPLDYVSFVWMMTHSCIIISDSGGVQEEAPSLGKPVLVTRDTTERPEAVDAGAVKLVGSDAQVILKYANELLDFPDKYAEMSEVINPYGNGTACAQIVKFIEEKIV
tara:strand:+ start:5596 stop:6732 length:1137 start_codon:yes stop_codon:yes gene_type:complete